MSPLPNRTRGLIKKLNRIVRIEEARAAGKPINDDQGKLLERRAAVEDELAAPAPPVVIHMLVLVSRCRPLPLLANRRQPLRGRRLELL